MPTYPLPYCERCRWPEVMCRCFYPEAYAGGDLSPRPDVQVVYAPDGCPDVVVTKPVDVVIHEVDGANDDNEDTLDAAEQDQ